MSRIPGRLLLWIVVLLAVVVVLGWVQGCSRYACTDDSTCNGFVCDKANLVCLDSCSDDSQCNTVEGYVCQSITTGGQSVCVCDPKQPKAYCHFSCFTEVDCQSRAACVVTITGANGIKVERNVCATCVDPCSDCLVAVKDPNTGADTSQVMLREGCLCLDPKLKSRLVLLNEWGPKKDAWQALYNQWQTDMLTWKNGGMQGAQPTFPPLPSLSADLSGLFSIRSWREQIETWQEQKLKPWIAISAAEWGTLDQNAQMQIFFEFPSPPFLSLLSTPQGFPKQCKFAPPEPTAPEPAAPDASAGPEEAPGETAPVETPPGETPPTEPLVEKGSPEPTTERIIQPEPTKEPTPESTKETAPEPREAAQEPAQPEPSVEPSTGPDERSMPDAGSPEPAPEPATPDEPAPAERPTETASPDAGASEMSAEPVLDAASPDAGTPDTGAPDAGSPDTREPSTNESTGEPLSDAGSPDAGEPTSPELDESVQDASSDGGSPDAPQEPADGGGEQVPEPNPQASLPPTPQRTNSPRLAPWCSRRFSRT